MPERPKTYEITLGKGTKVTTDNKSKTRIVSLPFEFPDDTQGVLIVCRIKDEEWVPVTDITSLTITFK